VLTCFSVENPKPEWGKLWRIKPLLLSPIIGAIGGVGCYILHSVKTPSKFFNGILILIGVFILLIFVWIGTILGLDGTLWD